MFGSSWANPQQNQQNQQQPSAFGQPSGFGTTSAFGSGGAFGQPQQQQPQPQANPMFGNMAGTNTGTTGTGFGAFGSNNTSNAGGGLFGQPKPATGFGAFGGGGTSTFGSTPSTTPAFGSGGGAFGSSGTTGTTTGTGLFGSQSSTSTGAFGGGSGGGLFGANKPATGFGTTPAATDTSAPVTTGTANPPFSAYTEKDNINPSTTLQYQSITAMPQYRSASFEELRLQDYAQGRKTAGAFGQTSFGATAQPAQPSTGLFGQPAAPAATGTTFGGFGNTSTTAQPATTGFGAFGQPATTNNTTGSSLFGGGGAFGQQNQPQQPQQQQPSGFGAFGQPQTQQPATGVGLFGGGGAFGANNQTKPAFGTGTTGFGTTGAFGQTQPNTQQPAAGGLFGQNQTNTTTSGFGAFGTNNNAPKPSLFGGTTNTTQPTTTAFGAFGTQNQTQPQQTTQPSGGLFGGGGGLFGQNQQQQNTQQQQPTTGGLFGNSQPAQQQTGGGLFGGGGGLFGNTQANPQQGAQQQQNQSSFGGLFGAKPATTTTQQTGGLFGGGFGTTNTTLGQQQQNQQTTGGLFGSTLGQQPQNQQASNTFGSGGLFGKPAAPTLGVSTSTGQQQGGLGSSLFGNNTLGGSTATMGASTLGQSQAPLTASIAQPIAAPLPIFSMLPPGPRAVTLDQQPKKKPGYFVDVPTRSPVPQLQLRYAPAGTKLRGFGSTSTPAGASSSALSGSLLYSSGKPNALSLSKASTNKSLLGPDAFLTNGSPSPTLGSGGRQSVKKLTLDKKVEPADLFSKSGNGPSFNPALSLAAREKEAAAANASNAVVRVGSPSPAGRNESPKKPANRFAAQTTSEMLGSPTRPAPARAASPSKGPKDPSELQEGDYWVKPDLETLKKMGHDELVSFSGLTVGRVGYGQITFLEPVDLTGLPRLSSLLGEIVRFDDKECSVYPEADDADKPPPGSGLNVKARIELIRCWALDKATREPIKDPEHPAAQRHLKRLKNMKETHFEGFDVEEGKWTFSVDHF